MTEAEGRTFVRWARERCHPGMGRCMNHDALLGRPQLAYLCRLCTYIYSKFRTLGEHVAGDEDIVHL